jgi:uncharacterized protein (TIGR03790 family)
MKQFSSRDGAGEVGLPHIKPRHRPNPTAPIRRGFLLAILTSMGVVMGLAAPVPAADPTPTPPAAPTQDRGQSVVVIYNTAFKGSKDVADHYAKRRNVPEDQVFGFQLPTSETIGRSEYESKLERPLVEALVQRQLVEIRDQIRPATETAPGRVLQMISQAKVRHIVVCYGVPIRTTNDVTLVEPEAQQMQEPLRRADASIDAELTALPLLLAGQPRTGPLGNPAYGTTNQAALQPTAGLFVVGRLDGPTPDLAKALVDRAIEAEEFGLWGRGYFDIRSIASPAYKPGDQWISNAWVAVSRYGYDTHLDTHPATLPEGFPLSHVAFYAGWYEANMNGPFTQPKVEFMPGAIAYHLHSYSAGALRSSDRTWVGPLIAKGVTATMGCVSEPYLDGTPDIGLCLARLMFSGFTWGEAALASQRMLSWQTTVIGDPLYHPYRLNALERLKDLTTRRQGRADWALVVLYNRRYELTRNLAETLKSIEAEPRTRISPILREKLADFQHAAGLHENAALSYREAAGLRASPQQRKRLLWNCGQSFEAANRPSDAYDAYLEYRREASNAPNLSVLLERLEALATTLKRDKEAAKWRSELEKLKSQEEPSTAPPAARPSTTPAATPAEPAGLNNSPTGPRPLSRP